MHDNYFDIVMAHIEENVSQSTDEIKKQIPLLIGRHSRAFNESFYLLTGYTLDYYIKQRRLHHAARELVVNRDKPICDIALDYHFFDQSAFTRAIKEKYKVTPKVIRDEGLWSTDESFCLRQFTGGKPSTRVEKILRRLEVSDHLSGEDMCLMCEIEEMSDQYGFDIEVCYQIADLAERLEIPLDGLAEHCFDAVAEVKSHPGYIPPDVECAVNLGISSREELNAICEFFRCEYYELDSDKVYIYQHQKKE